MAMHGQEVALLGERALHLTQAAKTADFKISAPDRDDVRQSKHWRLPKSKGGRTQVASLK